jgi:hypothetical protein
MQAVKKKKKSTRKPAPAYLPLIINFGITKYISEYARNIWGIMKKRESTMASGSR